MPAINLGGAPLVIPAGKAATVGTGSVPVAIPVGKAVTTATGSVPVAIPAGLAATSAFGTPVVSTGATPQTVSPTGVAVTTARGGVALVVPAGLALTATLNTPPIAVPFGAGASSAFGSPNVSLTVVTSDAPTTTQLAGRGWAAGNFGWDALLSRWEQLQRDEATAEVERLSLRQELRAAPKSERPALEQREEDLDERIDDLRWKMQLIRAEIVVQQHEQRVAAAAAQQALLDDDENAIMLLL